MGLKISKKHYTELIQEDLDYLNNNLPDGSVELDHIKAVLCLSIDWLYPEQNTSKEFNDFEPEGSQKNN